MMILLKNLVQVLHRLFRVLMANGRETMKLTTKIKLHDLVEQSRRRKFLTPLILPHFKILLRIYHPFNILTLTHNLLDLWLKSVSMSDAVVFGWEKVHLNLKLYLLFWYFLHNLLFIMILLTLSSKIVLSESPAKLKNKTR